MGETVSAPSIQDAPWLSTLVALAVTRGGWEGGGGCTGVVWGGGGWGRGGCSGM